MKRMVLLLCLSVPVALAGVQLDAGRFSAGDLDGWRERRFEGRTHYELAEVDGVRALRAESRGAASGLYRRMRIDLERTPYLRWSWRIENVLPEADERTRAGDDYPARIYVVLSGGVAFWRTRAVNYVWSSNEPEGASWPNAFTANAYMVAVRAGDSDVGRWVEEWRDVRADFRRLFGVDVRYVDGVALMTDTDNTGASAVAWYGDIYFSAERP
jgi:hypothetical protein